MDNIVLLFACLSIGMALRQFNRAPDNAHVALNMFIIHVSLPAVTLLQIHRVSLDPSLLYAVLMPWLLFGASAALFWAVGHALRLPPTTTGALVVVGGLGNTSFIGLPMIDSFYGPGGLPVGIMIDQFGTYLVLSTVGILLICGYAEGAVSWRDMVKRIATFPPLIALGTAVVLLPLPYPVWTMSMLARLGDTLAPLALVSVGLQLRLAALRGNRRLLALGLGYKLMLAPLMVLLVYAGVAGLGGGTTKITVFEAAMAPQVGGSIIAIQYGLDARLISLTVGIGTVLSFATLPFWWFTMQAVGL